MDILGCGVAKIPLAKICELLMIGASEAGFEDLPSVVKHLKIETRVELRCLLKNLGLASNI